MQLCPFCGSEDIYYSKKRKVFVCEDCDETFTEENNSNEEKSAINNGLELFFSYGHDKNRLLVERIKRDMEKRGHHVWIDTNEIKAGDHWRDDILSGVLKASSVIAFLSEHSTRNPGVCLDELKIAVCVKGANIKTVLLEPEIRIKPPATLSDIQWLDMSNWYEMKRTSDDAFEEWYRGKFAELCRVVESGEIAELNGEIHSLKERLSPYLNSKKEYNLLSKEFYGRRWLEDYIENWQDNKTTKALVIYGKPGSGKSAFCVNYSHFNSDVYGCFLCEWNHEYSINPNRLIRTIAFRLATKLRDYRTLLLRQLEQNSNLDEMSAEALFDFLLSYPLSHLVDGNRETGLIVVDGIDEAESDGDNPLAAVFAKCLDQLPRWIKFVLTSRPEKNVSKYFHSYECVDIVDSMPEGYNDIMAYLIKALSDELQRIPNKLELLRQICDLSDGVFLYAELLVTDIKNGSIKINDLNIIPKGLGSFYRLSMERKFPTDQSIKQAKEFLELLCIAESIPENLLCAVCGYTQYTFLTCLDKLGSWVNRFEENGLYMLAFVHKSFKDWFVNREQSGEFFVNFRFGALRMARYCRKYIENDASISMNPLHNSAGLSSFVKNHVGQYYKIAGKFDELEHFMIGHVNEPDPFWRVWKDFPDDWDNSALLNVFWNAKGRNEFLRKLQREGSVSFLRWILDIAVDKYSIKGLDKELIEIYMDIVHMSGEYAKAVSIAEQYLVGNTDEIAHNEFLAMLSVRRLHHLMFYTPAERVINEAKTLYSRLDDRYPRVYNELLFLIGGNLGILYGDNDFCITWLSKSVQFAEEHALEDYCKRNDRKMADYYCCIGEFSAAQIILKKRIPTVEINGRYEAYLVGALGNVYTCISYDDEAIECYEKLLEYTTGKGMIAWSAHANLGIANVNYKLGNVKEAVDFANRARIVYSRIKQEWGLIMTEALLAACESRMGVAPMRIACDNSIRRAKRMQYGSCISAIEDMCVGRTNYLRLLFL